MPKVYILIWYDAKETVIIGVFGTMEKAQDEFRAQVKSEDYDYRIDEYMVQ